MSRLDLDLNDTTLPLSEFDEQFEHYLKVRVGRSSSATEAAMADIMSILNDLVTIEPALKETHKRWQITILLYTGALCMAEKTQ